MISYGIIKYLGSLGVSFALAVVNPRSYTYPVSNYLEI